jgi:hypothetical protein
MIDPPQEIGIPRLKQSDKKGGAAGRQPSPAQHSTKEKSTLASTSICISRSRARPHKPGFSISRGSEKDGHP